ncbi:hypothetical protein M422DRAFT_783785 [Sphaerobolus stellatus SS14]|uniref:Uncharacterized protein n=1 Tax=Sphaerobolus stellatus (strain SS14) TaxID=990650 RepID=A0A0C9V1T3_SPHS4|nr:hypothetical protein M422DRAFT_783785 [Sphaerobolus stellatus SS14]
MPFDIYNDDPIDDQFSLSPWEPFLRMKSLFMYLRGEGPAPSFHLHVNVAVHIATFFAGLPELKIKSSVVNEYYNGNPDDKALTFAVLIRQYGPSGQCALNGYGMDLESPGLANYNSDIARGLFLKLLAKHAETSLRFIFKAWLEYSSQHHPISKSGISHSPPWLMVFSILVSSQNFSLVVYHPSNQNIQEFKPKPSFTSTILDTILFHPTVKCRTIEKWTIPDTEDESWIADRL